MVLAVSDLVKASRAMRCFSEVSSNSSIVRFTDTQDDLNDSGDGGGAPVFKLISMSEFEDLAQELVEMFISKLQLKRLIVLELLSINLKEGADSSPEWSDELYDRELYEFPSTSIGAETAAHYLRTGGLMSCRQGYLAIVHHMRFCRSI